MLISLLHKRTKSIFVHPEIVTIDKQNIFSYGLMYTHITCIAKAAILFVNDTYSCILLCKFITKFRTIIWRTIINKNYFYISITLLKQTIYTTF